MINKVFISYNQSEAVTFCFWKYFFEACGIELESEMITKEWSKMSKNGPCLIILGSGKSSYIFPTEAEQCVYLVKHNAEYRKYYNKSGKQYRNDVIPMVRWDSINYAFIPVLERLVMELDERERLKEILQIFIEEKFWSTAWLYSEIAYEGKSGLDPLISDSCTTMGARLRSLSPGKSAQSDWYRQFSLLYCEYIQCGTRERTLMRRLSDSQELLKKCRMLAKIRGWVPSLCMFAGKICELSQIAHKYALDYYKSIPSEGRTADTYCNVGYIYERYTGDEALARREYENALQLDPMHFRAAYSLGVCYTAKGEWIVAYSLLNRIVHFLSVRLTPAISVRELEYYYKSLQMLLLICEQNINGDDFEHYYRTEILKLRKYLKDDFEVPDEKSRKISLSLEKGNENDAVPEKGRETAFLKMFRCMNMGETTQEIVAERIYTKFKIPKSIKNASSTQ